MHTGSPLEFTALQDMHCHWLEPDATGAVALDEASPVVGAEGAVGAEPRRATRARSASIVRSSPTRFATRIIMGIRALDPRA